MISVAVFFVFKYPFSYFKLTPPGRRNRIMLPIISELYLQQYCREPKKMSDIALAKIHGIEDVRLEPVPFSVCGSDDAVVKVTGWLCSPSAVTN